jgi:predicted CXXCH cytochrome family protein
MACHLESTSFPLPNAIQRYDRGPFSFRPGEALANFLLNFDHAPGTGRDGKFEIVNAAYRMRQSACFVKSKMTCTTCHNPHDAPRGAEAVRHHDAACRQCHATVAQHAGRQHDCAGCHMPKRRTEDVVHAVATDHLIQRHKPPGDLLAERSEHRDDYRGPVVLYYPATLPPTPESELYLAVAQVKQKANLKAGIAQLTTAIRRHAPTRAEWYLELAEALDADGQLAKSVAMYREAVRRDGVSYVALQRLGTVLRRSRQLAESADVLKRSLALAPARALTWHEIALTFRAQGRTSDASSALETALKHDPDMPEAQNNLGILRASTGDFTRAEASLREAIRIQPHYADAHGNLANVLAAQGRATEARAEFEHALRLRPADAPVRYNYAMLLGRTGRYADALRELEACLRADPAFASAHESLGDFRLAQGDAARAVASYRELVRLQPDSGRAHLALGSALAALGDRNAARPHLQRAAQDRDADVRRRAAELLGKLP